MNRYCEMRITPVENGWIVLYKDQSTYAWGTLVFTEWTEINSFVKEYCNE